MPQTFEDVIELLIPELRKRGLFWDDYCVPSGTYRENAYGIPGQVEPPKGHPAEAMIWRPPNATSHSNAKGSESIPKGVANSHANGDVEGSQERIDPISMQFG